MTGHQAQVGCSGGNTRSSREDGFTLIEVVVSLTLLSLLLALTPTAVRVGRQAWQTEAQLERAAAIAVAENVIRRVIADAVPVRFDSGRSVGAVRFDGATNAVSFVAPAPSSLDGGGLQIYRLTTRPRNMGLGQDLVINTRPFGYTGAGPASDAAGADAVETATILIADVSALSVRYFGASANGGDRVWSRSWSGRGTLPALVEISYAFAGGGTAPEPIMIAPRIAGAH